MLRIDHLCKTYPGGKKAVDDLSLHVRPGELYGFIGHNGAGKTTTLRAVAGIIGFEGGTIAINGHDIVKDDIAAKRITAFLPDNPDLYEFLTGIKFLNFIADVYDMPKESRWPLIQKYADAFQLTSDLGNAIGSYSHGMKQKLALISAFMRQPRLMVLDEPFVGLDPVSSFQMKEFLRELCRGGGAVLFSTHVLDVAEKLCDKIAIIKNGRLVEAGRTAELVGNSSLESVFLELEHEQSSTKEV